MKKLFICLIVLILTNFQGKADSPLTSTSFHTSYDELPIMKHVYKSNGKLNAEIFRYLVDMSNPIDNKIAVTNGLGWNIGGKNNSKKFLNYLNRSDLFENEQELLASDRSDLIICYAYLMAMDNYFDVDKAFRISQLAVKLNSASLTTNIISSLIHSQTYLNKDWKMIYTSLDNVRQNKKLVQDMKKEATEIVYDYIDLYK